MADRWVEVRLGSVLGRGKFMIGGVQIVSGEDQEILRALRTTVVTVGDEHGAGVVRGLVARMDGLEFWGEGV